MVNDLFSLCPFNLDFLQNRGLLCRHNYPYAPKVCTFFFLLLITVFVQAQFVKVTLSGAVKDANSKVALAFVNITLSPAKDSQFVAGTISRRDGRFQLPDITSGNYRLLVSDVGYASKT